MNQLKKMGYAADAEANGLEVLKALERIPYDIVLMDCQMPELDGYETTRELRRREPSHTQLAKRHCPVHVIAITANAMNGDRERCLAAGMNDYVSKPVRVEELQAALDRWPSAITASADACADESTHSRPETPAAASLAAPTVIEYEESPVELERLTEVTGGDAEQMREMVELYLAQAEDLIRQLEQAIAAQSAPEVGRLAHKLAGSSVTCGMTAIVAPLRELERLGREGQLDDAAQLQAQAREQFERIQQYLEHHLQLATSV